MGHITTRQLLIFTFFSALVGSTAAAATCYLPDGSESGDTPCSDASNTEVFCCPSGSTCINSPGPLCRQSNGNFLRGSCTVQDWSSSACPKFCIAINSDNPIDRCSIGSGNGHFCCGYDADKSLCDCVTNNNTFVLASYTPIQVMGAASTTTSSRSSTARSTASTTTFSSSATSVSAASATASATQTADSGGLTTGAKVGLGVGIPLALAFLGVLGFFLWKKSKPNGQGAHQPVPASDMHNQQMYPPGQYPPSGYAPSMFSQSGYSQSAYNANYNDPTKAHHEWYQQNPGYTPTNDGSGTLNTLNYSTHSPDPPMQMHELPASNHR